jgi:outer membrane protein insertion porin family
VAILRVHQDSPAIRGGTGYKLPAALFTGGASFSFRRTCLRFPTLEIAVLLLVLGFAGPLLAQPQPDVIGEIQIHGNRSVPADTVRSHIFTRPGDVYDQAAIERDFNSLWNTNYFEDIRFEREATPKGWILHIYVKEKPRIKDISYVGINAISKSDILDRFKEAKVGISPESQYDPTKVKKAEVVLKQLLAEHGHQFATIRTEVRPIPPASVGVTSSKVIST